MSKSVSKDDLVTQDLLKRDESTWRATEKLENFLGRAEELAAVFDVGGWGRGSTPIPKLFSSGIQMNIMYDIAIFGLAASPLPIN